MCGIAGYVDFTGGSPSKAVLKAMADTIRHRGPDEEGTRVDGICGLAHRRLSIIDLAGSHQPLAPEDSSIALVYNGELYNYRQLRERYHKQGISFGTVGDTEVLLRAVELRGIEAIREFEGMYAFAAWNREKQRLLLARDPLGKKPLFYAQPRPGLFVFGSEIKALLAHPEVPCALDEDGLRQVLRFRSVYGSGSLYAGIRQLEPGSTLELSADGLTTTRHYRLEKEALGHDYVTPDDEEGAIGVGLRLLTDAVRKRLVADVPVGAFLSGGLDSSLIVALMQELRGGEPHTHTFSVGFSGDEHSELGYARVAARALGTVHTEVALSPSDYAACLGRVTRYRDAPISEPADIAIYRMSEVARSTVKVVLSGEGSDEIFCGYPKYALAAVPMPLRALVRGIGVRAVSRIAAFAGLDARRVRIAARALAGRTELDRLVQWFSYLDRLDLMQLLPGLEWNDGQWNATMAAQAEILARSPTQDPRRRMQLVDCATWLPGNLLERGDRMTMAAGLELRVPFLDPNVVRYGLQLGPRLKVRGRSLKWVVRRWARDRVPAEIIDRPKWGFRVPLSAWFRGALRSELHDRLQSSRSLCAEFGNPSRISRLLEEHDSGVADHSLALWTLLSSEVWYQEVFRSSCQQRAVAVRTDWANSALV